jgi:hypothetical protein
LLLEAGVFGLAAGVYSSEHGTAEIGDIFVAVSSYFLLLKLIFNVLLADKDQHLLKIEKLREIDQFFEEIKMNKLAAQQGVVAAA